MHTAQEKESERGRRTGKGEERRRVYGSFIHTGEEKESERGRRT